MKMLRRLAVAFVCVVCCFAADTAEAPETTLRTAAVAAFKNGLGFVLKQGVVTLQGGSASLGQVPNATLGSLWVAPGDPGASLDEVVAHRYRVTTLQNSAAMSEVLLANPGRVVTVVDNNQKEYTGEIVGLPQPDKTDAKQTPPQVVPEFFLLKSEGKVLALYFRNLARVTLPADAVFQQKREEERTALRVHLKGVDTRANLTMGYLESGLGWTPSYLISLQDNNKAQLTMQAVLVNDAEEMQDTDVFFVVGVPNFAYSHILSPMALQQNLLDFMKDASRQDNSRQPYSNVIMGQARGELMKSGAAFDALSLESPFEELQGAPEEDLFLYSRKGVTLAKGQRATYNVFSESVGFEHVYQWDIKDQPRVDGFGNVQNQNAVDSTAENSIWHSLRLKNTTKFPWTSAPAMVISGTQPLSQETLPYTPKGATSNLKLTIATDIRAAQQENEVARQQGIQRRRNYSYDEVTVEGTLKIKNYKSKEVHLAITRTVRGTVESQTDAGTSDKLAEAIAVDNPLSRLNWEITLKPGEERSVTYRYKVWLRV